MDTVMYLFVLNVLCPVVGNGTYPRTVLRIELIHGKHLMLTYFWRDNDDTHHLI